MLRYQASMYSDSYGNVDNDVYHTHLQPSTIASSNGLRAQQGRIIKRQPANSYKNMSSTTCRLAPRRRYFVMDGQKSLSSSSAPVSFPGPDYLKRVKESYESGKIIYIRRNIPGLKNSSIAPRMTSTINNSIRSTTYHTTTTPAPSNSKVMTENGQKYLFRLPKNDLNKFDENQPNGNMYVQAYEPPKVQYTTVPACMSMGGEYVYEEEVEEENFEMNNEGNDDLMPAELFNSLSPNVPSPKCKSPDNGYLKSSGQLVHHSSIGTSTSTCSTPGLQNNNQTFKMLPGRNRLQPTRYTCPQADCFWRGPNDLALRKHMQVHGPKQPVMYSGVKNGDAMKVQLVQPKPKGVKCSECDTFAYSRPLLLRHMHDAHGIEAPLIRRTFANREMLQTWLDSLRETHAVEFVVSSGSKKWGRGLQVHYLTCSRSGDQKERPNKKYVRPPRPSIKCGRNCMAYLKIKQNPTVSELQIEGCLHHSGHEIDHTRMMLEPNELSSIGCIIDAVGDGLDITGNVESLRGYLGNSGRFRLVSDRGIIDQMPIWFEQYNRAMPEYMNDGNQMMHNMYRGSGALTNSSNEVPNSFCSSGPLLPMKSSTVGSRIINLSAKNGMNCDIKRELDYEFKKMPIRFNSHQNRMMGVNNQGFHQKMFEDSMYDETKVKLEIDEEDALAAQNLLKDEYDEVKHENIFDSPMIGGEESRMIEDDDILCGGEEASGITSSLGRILNSNLPDPFSSSELCAVDDINTDFNCGMNDDEFNEVIPMTDGLEEQMKKVKIKKKEKQDKTDTEKMLHKQQESQKPVAKIEPVDLLAADSSGESAKKGPDMAKDQEIKLVEKIQEAVAFPRRTQQSQQKRGTNANLRTFNTGSKRNESKYSVGQVLRSGAGFRPYQPRNRNAHHQGNSSVTPTSVNPHSLMESITSVRSEAQIFGITGNNNVSFNFHISNVLPQHPVTRPKTSTAKKNQKSRLKKKARRAEQREEAKKRQKQ